MTTTQLVAAGPAAGSVTVPGVAVNVGEPSFEDIWSDDSVKYPHWSYRFPGVAGGAPLLDAFIKHYALGAGVDVAVIDGEGVLLVGRDPTTNSDRGHPEGVEEKAASIREVGLMNGFGGAWLFPLKGNAVLPFQKYLVPLPTNQTNQANISLVANIVNNRHA